MSQNGKGDKRRPQFISEEELAERWELAFQKKKDDKKVKADKSKKSAPADANSLDL